jgi:hypothetical protein
MLILADIIKFIGCWSLFSFQRIVFSVAFCPKQSSKLFEDSQTELAKAKFAQARELDANVVFGDEEFKQDLTD